MKNIEKIRQIMTNDKRIIKLMKSKRKYMKHSEK